MSDRAALYLMDRMNDQIQLDPRTGEPRPEEVERLRALASQYYGEPVGVQLRRNGASFDILITPPEEPPDEG